MPCYKDNITRNLENTRSTNMNEITKSQSLNNMRTPPRKVSLMWIWLPITFGVILCITIISLYFFKFGEYGLSDNPSEWSSFGSLLSGAFSLLSAIGTIGTLMFIILQHQQVTKAQEEISRKQMEILEFEKYEKHKSTFYEAFDFIDIHFSNHYYFPSKARAYHQLFPDNSPISTSYHSRKEGEIIYYANQFGEVIKSAKNGQISIQQLEIIFKLIEFIKISPRRDRSIYHSGDVRIGRTEPKFNIFSLKECFQVCYQYFYEFFRITGVTLALEEPNLEIINFKNLSTVACKEMLSNIETELDMYLRSEIRSLFTINNIIEKRHRESGRIQFKRVMTVTKIVFRKGYKNIQIDNDYEFMEEIEKTISSAKTVILLDKYRCKLSDSEIKEIERIQINT